MEAITTDNLPEAMAASHSWKKWARASLLTTGTCLLFVALASVPIFISKDWYHSLKVSDHNQVEQLGRWAAKYGGSTRRLDDGTFAVLFARAYPGAGRVFESLATLPEGCTSLVSELSLNYISVTPSDLKSICRLTRLTKLTIYQCKNVTTLPPEIWQLTGLIELLLVKNSLTEVSVEVRRLTNLTDLSLGGNQLTTVPQEIGQLKNLTSLGLGLNKLTHIPPELGQLTHLTSLDLSNNHLTSLPRGIGQLTGLNKLYLDHNPLRDPPPEIVEQGTEKILANLRR